ncbi:hypothetical protein [Bradyrhizobium sp. CCGUVB23]|uniref:hypothetical protein n=1 Tax=Bradyrhizobium sp. CCGUVB23 TaxID=2949630 RepID=UPI0020B1B99F|nr:hypothetical protein [Bradyrhizobium sp. CCGUVB23]MCP3468537.1 hypothetical protein [Bradyrhizobium sp. CCGUVB23]
MLEVRKSVISKLKVAAPLTAMAVILPIAAKPVIWSSSAQYGSYRFDGYTWNNDVFGSGAGPQTISVSSINQWSTGGVKSYPHEAHDVAKPLDSIITLKSSFNQLVPSAGAWDTAYDIWSSSNDQEIMIWTNYTGDSNGGGNVKPISYKYDPHSGAAIPVYTNVNLAGVNRPGFAGGSNS